MPQTITNILQGVYDRLHKRIGDTSLQLENLGGTAIVSTTATLTRYADDVAQDIARDCFPIPGQAAYNLTAGIARYRVQSFTSSLLGNTAADASVMWKARHVFIGGTALMECGFGVLERDRFYTVNATGTPLYWTNEGDGFISFYPVPSATASLTAIGYCLPPSFNTSATATWLSEDANTTIELGIVDRVAQAMRDDPDAYARLTDTGPQYMEEKGEMRSRVPSDVARYLWGREIRKTK